MKKIMSISLLICAIIFVLTACHMTADQPESYETADEAGHQERAGLTENIEIETTQPTGPAEMPEDMDGKDNTKETGALESNMAANYILPDSDSRLYGQWELEGLSQDQLKLARNEIYARHGRRFKDEGLQTYFQSKSWYHGTVEPDEFDDGQMNQTERDNLGLLLRLEKESLEGRAGYPMPPYAEAFAAWDSQHKNQKISEKLFSDGGGTIGSTEDSRVIIHDQFYEITNCQAWADDVYDFSLFDGKMEGDRVTVEGEDFIIKEIITDNGLRKLTLTYVNQEGKSAEWTSNGWEANIYLQECSEGFYEKLANDICGPNRLIYEGSLYFYRDARIDTGMMGGLKTITAQEYFEVPLLEKEFTQPVDDLAQFTRAGGLQKNGEVHLNGIPSYDQYYYFTGFMEVSRNWIG